MEQKNLRYLFFGVFIILTILAFLIIKPFITAILTSIVLAYLFYPLYKLFNKKMSNTLAAVLVLLISLMLFVIPTLFIIEALFKESINIYNYIKVTDFGPFINNALDRFFRYVVEESQGLIRSVPRFILNLFISFFLFYYFIKDGDKIIDNVKRLMPVSRTNKNIVIKEFKRVTSAVVYGLILIGLIVGVFAALGFYIFKISNPILLGLITILVSMLPGVGTSVIWVPAGIIKIIQGDLFNGIGLLIYGFIFISGFEVLFKPRLISYKSDIHPAIIVLGIFGGLALLGFTGLFFGPLILVTFITFLKHLLNKT